MSGPAARKYGPGVRSSLPSSWSELRREKGRLQYMHFLDKLLPASRKRDELFSLLARTKVLPDFFKDATEASSGGKRTEA